MAEKKKFGMKEKKKQMLEEKKKGEMLEKQKMMMMQIQEEKLKTEIQEETKRIQMIEEKERLLKEKMMEIQEAKDKFGGAVNFSILHNFLHVFLQKSKIKRTRVEFRGEDAKRIRNVIATAKCGPSLHIYESKIVSEDDHFIEKSESAPVSPLKAKYLRADSVKKKEDQETDSVEKEKDDQESDDSENESDTCIYIETIIGNLTPTAFAFNQLEESVERLEKQFASLQELSTNSELVERLKGNITDPLTDMWNIISLNKRLDATEKGIEKLTSMIQDVIKSDHNIINVTQEKKQTKEKITEEVKDQVDEKQFATDVPSTSAETKTKADADAKRDEMILTCLNKCQDLDTEFENEIYQLQVDVKNLQEERNVIESKIESISNMIKLSKKDTSEHENIDHSSEGPQTLINFNIEARVQKLEGEIVYVIDKLKHVISPGETEEKALQELITTIQELQDDMKKINETADNIRENTASNNIKVDKIMEEVEYLQKAKADYEEMRTSLADKVDFENLKHKVSIEDFDEACQDISEGMKEIIEQLQQSNENANNIFDQLAKEIEEKVDKLEIKPLQNYLNKYAKFVDEKIKQSIKERNESTAAGTTKMIRGLHCLSCTKEAVMKTEETGRIEAPAMPGTKSTKPNLTYHLDQIRKQQIPLPSIKDRKAMEKIKAFCLEVEAACDDNTSNRYCGGSHTKVITKQPPRLKQPNDKFVHLGPEVKELASKWLRAYSNMAPQSEPTLEEDVCPTAVPGPSSAIPGPSSAVPGPSYAIPGPSCEYKEKENELEKNSPCEPCTRKRNTPTKKPRQGRGPRR
ncbi:hypothetical protein M0802_011404 [Mischocyttarus mexicanus]|nr:hypothetical protein M0802_011404 [Mischocyttarus mexicanus]